MKRAVSILLLVVVLAGLTAGAAVVAANKASAFAQQINAQKTALVDGRVGQTVALLETLCKDSYISDLSIPFIDKAAFLTAKNQNEHLGYMMLRILDGSGFIYREDVGAASDLSSRDYMQALYATGKTQVTDAFLAGADGVTLNYTVAAGIVQNGKVAAALMAAIYGTEMDEYLHDDMSQNVLVGSQMQYMSGVPAEQFGLPVSQALTAMPTTRPQSSILADFAKKQSGLFWRLGLSTQCVVYSPVSHSNWMVLTAVSLLPVAADVLIGYAVAVALWVVAVVWVVRKQGKGRKVQNAEGAQG